MCLISSYSDTFTHDVVRDDCIALHMTTAYRVLCSHLNIPVACPNDDRGFDGLTRNLVDDHVYAAMFDQGILNLLNVIIIINYTLKVIMFRWTPEQRLDAISCTSCTSYSTFSITKWHQLKSRVSVGH